MKNMDESIAFNLNELFKKLTRYKTTDVSNIPERLKEPFEVTVPRVSRSKNELCRSNPHASEFLQLCDQLDTRNCKELDRYIILLNHFKAKPSILEILKANKNQENNSSFKHILKTSADLMERATKNTSKNTTLISSNSSGSIQKSKFSTLDFVDPSVVPLTSTTIQLTKLTRIEEENIVIRDLINCLMNNPGIYVKPDNLNNGKRQFCIDESMHKSFREVVQNVIEVCNNISTVARFIDEYSGSHHGVVNQALAAAVNAQLRQFRLDVCRLQCSHLTSSNTTDTQQGITLSYLLTWLQTPAQGLRTMAVLCGDTITNNTLRGGTVLSALTKKILASGSPEERKLLNHLLQCATVPFFRILRLWIYRGIIKDPYKEFFIFENENVSLTWPPSKCDNVIRADYWEKHYCINHSLVPKFLDNHVDTILDTGKYLNVIQLAGDNADFGVIEEMVYEIEEQHYIVQIERAYSHASQLLMDILFKEKRLNDHFKFMKHYFLLNHADWLSHFMYLASDELNDFAKDCQMGRLESLLDVAVQAGSCLNESLKDNLKVELSNDDLMFFIFNIISFKADQSISFEPSGKNLRVLEAFSLSMTTEWPISLVFNSSILQHYQILFRHLFYCHHVERVLSKIWLTNKCSNVRYLGNVRLINKANVLGGRMRTFVQHLLYYMTIEVIEPGWLSLENKITQAKTLDDVFNAHSEFLQYCLMNCMLYSKTMLKNLQKMMVLCVNYSNRFNRLINSVKTEEGIKNSDGDLFHYDPRAFENALDSDDQNFSEIMANLILDIKKDKQYQKKLINLVTRLEFNDFYQRPNYTSDVDI